MIFEKYYNELGLPPKADDMQIKSAYRKLVKIYHPDKSGTAKTREKFIKINEAYEVLCKRNEYLQILLARHYLKRKQQEEMLRQETLARREAAAKTESEYKAFTNSRIYKTAMVFENVFNYVFLALGLLMIFGPIFTYFFIPHMNGSSSGEFKFFPLFIGLGFFTCVWYFIFKNKNS